MQIQIVIDTAKDSADHVAGVLSAVARAGLYITATPAEAERVAAREALHDAAEAATDSAPAAPAEPIPSAPQAPAEQAEAHAAGVEPAKRRGRPRKIVTEVNAEPAVSIAPAEQSAPTAAVASDATPPAGTAGEAPNVDGPMTAEGVLEAVFNRDGPSGAIACLQRFGVMRLRELKPDQRDEFVAYCRDVLAGKVDQNGSQQ